MCACEVLLQSRFGHVCDWKGNPLVYDNKKHSHKKWNGVIAFRSMNMFNDFNYNFRSSAKYDMSEF